jgi:hypothetical protein
MACKPSALVDIAMTKLEIINEIKQTAAANGGVPLGWRKFATETGIREPDWKGKLWARWSDAVREAGFTPNEMKEAYGESELLEKYAKLAQDLAHLPTVTDIMLSASQGQAFPNWKTLMNQFGGKPQLVAKLREYCQARTEYASVIALCDSYVPQRGAEPDKLEPNGQQIGFVYLMKSAKFYKIGKANVTGRRHRELAIQLPERLIFVHEIRTDDPFGIEAYWHNRFADKRRGGEWFELNAADVAAFKRRKFM